MYVNWYLCQTSILHLATLLRPPLANCLPVCLLPACLPICPSITSTYGRTDLRDCGSGSGSGTACLISKLAGYPDCQPRYHQLQPPSSHVHVLCLSMRFLGRLTDISSLALLPLVNPHGNGMLPFFFSSLPPLTCAPPIVAPPFPLPRTSQSVHESTTDRRVQSTSQRPQSTVNQCQCQPVNSQQSNRASVSPRQATRPSPVLVPTKPPSRSPNPLLLLHLSTFISPAAVSLIITAETYVTPIHRHPADLQPSYPFV